MPTFLVTLDYEVEADSRDDAIANAATRGVLLGAYAVPHKARAAPADDLREELVRLTMTQASPSAFPPPDAEGAHPQASPARGDD